jgi:hypothetical protein
MNQARGEMSAIRTNTASRQRFARVHLLPIITLMFLLTFPSTYQTPRHSELLFRSFDKENGILFPIGKLNIDTNAITYPTLETIRPQTAISSSPRRNYLAVMNYLPEAGYSWYRYCILRRDFSFQSCVETPNVDDALHYPKNVSWSSDESKFYFVELTENETWRFVEADVISGKTLRVLATSAQVQSFGKPMLSWTPDIKLLLNSYEIVSPSDAQSQPKLPVIRDFGLGTQVASASSGAGNTTVSGRFEVCGYSPQGNYIAGYDTGRLSDDGTKTNHFFLIFDREGNLIKYMNENQGTIPSGCPTWGADDSYFVYWDTFYDAMLDRFTRTNIVRYELKTASTTVLYGGEPFGKVGTLTPSPDGTLIAFTTSNVFFPNQIGLLDATGKIRYFGQPGHGYTDLFWMPAP